MLIHRSTRLHAPKPRKLMGETFAQITVRKQPAAKKKARVRCVVDTGADFTVLPRAVLEGLGVKPHRRESFEMANGSTIERDVGRVFVEFQERAEFTPAVFGESGDASLLGVLTLEELGLGVDPLRREIFPLELRM